MPHRPSFAEINLSHLKHNVELIYKLARNSSFFCPMVKANAYGHGDLEVVNALMSSKLSHFGVGLIEEAIHLRENRIQTPLLVFGMFDSQSCEAILRNDITPVISDFAELEYLQKKLSLYPNKRLKIHLKFNTGMNRLGIEVAEAERVHQYLVDNKSFILEGLCTHLLHGEDAGASGSACHQQLKIFFEVEERFGDFPHVIHALNSSAAANLYLRSINKKTNYPGRIGELGVRPGISLYGGQVATEESNSLDLRPVMSLKSKLAMLHSLQAGEAVSYGGGWRAEKKSLIGVVPIGYADGYFRSLSNIGEVLCHGVRLPIVGTVCMDYFMIDLTLIATREKIEVGDEVVLFGKQKDNQIFASDLAEKVGTISYEVLARISERVPRIYIQ